MLRIFSHVPRRLRPRHVLLAALVAIAVARGLPFGEHARAPGTAADAAAAIAMPAQPVPSAALDGLRMATARGDADASVALVHALLDAYDSGAGPAPLVEAMQWLQRDAETPQMLASGELQRVVLGACRREPLLRWSWLCHEGE